MHIDAAPVGLTHGLKSKKQRNGVKKIVLTFER